MLQHPLFQKNLLDLKFNLVDRFTNRFLSTGAACYYLAEEGINTRIHFYNYFALLNGGPFKARWILRAYSTDGKRHEEISGVFKGLETACVETAPLTRSLGTLGLCVGHICPENSGTTLRRTFSTVYYTEYYGGSFHSYMHSMGFPVPKLYNAHDYIITPIRPDAEPMMILSNSCNRTFRHPKILSEQGPHLEIQNHKQEILTYEVPPIAPLACRRVRMRDFWPNLDSFLDGQSALIRVRGPNVLYSPLFIQKGGENFLSMEHFQGLDWEDLQ